MKKAIAFVFAAALGLTTFGFVSANRSVTPKATVQQEEKAITAGDKAGFTESNEASW